MPRPQLSILALIAAVVGCSIAAAGLRSASGLWLSAFYTLTVVTLLAAVVASRTLRGSARTFWFGFAVFGWGFFVFGADPWMKHDDDQFTSFGSNLNRNLLMTRLIQAVVVRIRMGTDDLEQIDAISANTAGIVQLLLTLTLAVAGGGVAIWLKRRARRTTLRTKPVLPALVILAVIAGATVAYCDRPSPRLSREMLRDIRLSYENIDITDFQTWRYGDAPEGMNEPSFADLMRSADRPTVFRFQWLPTFDHPVAVRVTRTPAGARLRAVVLDGAGGYEKGSIAIDRTVDLGQGEWAELERRLAIASFWTMPTRLVTDEGVEDGASCIVEGLTGGRFHLVVRRGGQTDAAYLAFVELCRYFFDLTGLKTRKI